MIITLEGRLVFKGGKFVIIETGGIGYKVFVGPETLRKIQKKSDKVKLYTHMHQREEAPELYGFLNMAELEFFETLIGISGIGPRGALGVLGTAPIDTLKRAISAGETSYLTKVSGIGRKMAERIVVELKEKMGRGDVSGGGFAEEEDALDALRSLGYSLKEARDSLSKIGDDVSGTEKRVKEALRLLGDREIKD